MTVVAITSVKGSPGVTTTALMVAAGWPVDRPVAMAEVDPAGGDLAARFGLSDRMGWNSLSTVSKRGEGHVHLPDHLQALPHGPAVLLAGEMCENAGGALMNAQGPADLVLDLGRIHPASEQWLSVAGRTVVLARSTVESLTALRRSLPELRHQCHSNFDVVIVGADRYGDKEISSFLEYPVTWRLPDDPRTADVLCGRSARWGRVRRSALFASAMRLGKLLQSSDTAEVAA